LVACPHLLLKKGLVTDLEPTIISDFKFTRKVLQKKALRLHHQQLMAEAPQEASLSVQTPNATLLPVIPEVVDSISRLIFVQDRHAAVSVSVGFPVASAMRSTGYHLWVKPDQ
jgi:hypothetical protein